jgi:hypothetical protein
MFARAEKGQSVNLDIRYGRRLACQGKGRELYAPDTVSFRQWRFELRRNLLTAMIPKRTKSGRQSRESRKVKVEMAEIGRQPPSPRLRRAGGAEAEGQY